MQPLAVLNVAGQTRGGPALLSALQVQHRYRSLITLKLERQQTLSPSLTPVCTTQPDQRLIKQPEGNLTQTDENVLGACRQTQPNSITLTPLSKEIYD